MRIIKRQHQPSYEKRRRNRLKLRTIGKNGVGFGIATVFMLPIIWLAISTFKPVRELGTYPPTLIPSQPTMSNFSKAFVEGDFGLFIYNSIIVSAMSTVAVILLGI